MTTIPDSLRAVTELAREAGAEVLEIYQRGHPNNPTLKVDRSPLTEADLRAHDRIVAGLPLLAPGRPILSEESAAVSHSDRQRWEEYWLVDPLDGTKEFLSRNGEFTVNIALVAGHLPVLGVVYAPAMELLYAGLVGVGAWCARGNESWRPISVRPRAAVPIRVVGSRSHRGPLLDGYLRRLGPHELVSIGSSLKLCLVADGSADVYPRLGPTSEWDTAAGHAVLAAAGGHLVTMDGTPVEYNRNESLLNPMFVAYADDTRRWHSLDDPDGMSAALPLGRP